MAKLSIMGIAQESPRAPPEPAVPETLTLPITSPVVIDHADEIRRCLTRIELDSEIAMKLDEQITIMGTALTDPQADPWDRLDAETVLEPLVRKRFALEGSVLLNASDIAVHATHLVGEWREDELDEIGRHLIQGYGALGQIEVDCPGVLTHPTWRRIVAASCPF